MAVLADSPAVNAADAGPTPTKSSASHANPDLASRLSVERSDVAFGSRAVSLVDLPAGALFARIATATPGTKAYSSVQVAESAHIELNSELLYCNHSCDPSLVFDMGAMEVRVGEGRALRKGDSLTFFYPSTEWDMAQPFECSCGAEKCLGWIHGAKDIDEQVLGRYYLNEHIVRMLKSRAGEGGAGSAGKPAQ
ncbi:hypothetical protein EJ06DRAFT_531031 [Trichodelitschia bisporula]|uniref:Post-SET domain-containing protein n=1 Tax=Trichodelitschia bisporula TaxID=703511 RepID=A0A6G1HUA5_9PEZI|nr:hypothetical protein EJ06DRAFT_531031 [Trichodelitschia bisporula]